MSTPTEELTAVAVEPLTLHDQCDQCAPSQAYVRLMKGSATIDLCGHHYASHAERLLLTGWEVTHDTRSTLS